MVRENEPLSVLSDGKVIGRGATSTVYLLPDATVCKLFNPEFSFEEAERESRMAESAYSLGIRVPEPYGLVRFEDRVGLISEYIEGESLADVFVKEPEKYEVLFKKYLEELRRFHETKAARESFVSAKDLYLEKLARLRGTDWYTKEELDKMEKLVRAVPDRDTLVYGDYHPKNILVKDSLLYFVDLGDTCTGHPVFDWAMIANTHRIIPSVNPAYAEEYFAVPAERMLRLWEDLFARYFAAYSPEKRSAIEKGIMAFAVLRQGLSPADGRVFPEKILRANAAAAKQKLLPGIEAVSACLDW